MEKVPVFSTSQLGELFSVTNKTIAAWTKAGMPKMGHGRYHVKECLAWWLVNIEGTRDDDPGLIALKAENLKLRNAREALRLDAERGELISRADVLQAWVWRCSDLRAGLYSWSSRLPPVLEGKDVIELRLALRDAVDELLDAFCRDGQFTPKPETEEPNDDNR